MEKEIIIVSFSGGRTSAYMSWWLKTHMSWLYDFKFVYANTGQEHPKTLEFVNNVDKYLELNLVWVEAVIHQGERKGTTHKVVSYETADRDGIVFEDMIKKYGLPNQNFIHCTRELKLRPIHHWMKVNGYKDCRQNVLMFDFLGSPYIDLRTDLNSFLPKDLNKNISEQEYNSLLGYKNNIDFCGIEPEFEDILKSLKKYINNGDYKVEDLYGYQYLLLIPQLKRAKLNDKEINKVINKRINIIKKIE
jgi:hypothetical protein